MSCEGDWRGREGDVSGTVWKEEWCCLLSRQLAAAFWNREVGFLWRRGRGAGTDEGFCGTARPHCLLLPSGYVAVSVCAQKIYGHLIDRVQVCRGRVLLGGIVSVLGTACWIILSLSTRVLRDSMMWGWHRYCPTTSGSASRRGQTFVSYDPTCISRQFLGFGEVLFC